MIVWKSEAFLHVNSFETKNLFLDFWNAVSDTGFDSYIPKTNEKFTEMTEINLSTFNIKT